MNKILDKKIALITYSLTTGGAAIAADHFYRNASKGFTKVTIYDQSTLRARLSTKEKLIIKIGKQLGRTCGIDLYSFDFQKRYLTDHKIAEINEHDYILIHWAHFSTIGLQDIVLFKKPVIFVAHDMFLLNGVAHYTVPSADRRIRMKWTLENIVFFLLKRRVNYHRQKVLEAVDCIVCPSKWLSMEFTRVYPELLNRVIINFYADITETIAQKREEETDKTLPTICFASYGIRDNYRKGYHQFKAIVSEVLAHFPDLKIFIVGDGKIKVPNGPNVKLMGRCSPSELMSLLKASNVYIHTAFIDNLPNIITEAKMMGTYIFAFDVGGISEQVSEKEGTLIKPSETKIFANKLIKYIKNHVESRGDDGSLSYWSHEKIITENSYISEKWNKLFEEIDQLSK